MKVITKVIDKATDLLSDCLKNDAMIEQFPEIKDNIDYAQELLLGLMIELENFERTMILKYWKCHKDNKADSMLKSMR